MLNYQNSIQRQLQSFQGNEIELINKMSTDIQNVFAVRRNVAISQAIDIVSRGRNIDLSNLKDLLPPAERVPNLISVTRFDKKIGQHSGLGKAHIEELPN